MILHVRDAHYLFKDIYGFMVSIMVEVAQLLNTLPPFGKFSTLVGPASPS